MRKFVCVLLAVCLLSAGCAGLPATSGQVDRQAEAINDMEKQRERHFAGARPVTVLDAHYIGNGKRVRISDMQKLPKVFGRTITLVQMEPITLEEIAEIVTKEVGTPVRVSTHLGSSGGENAGQFINAMQVSYTGPFKGFLDSVAAYFGVTWEWQSKQGLIQFYRLKTRTFAVAAALGKVSVSSTISNISDTSGSQSGAAGEETTATQAASGEQTTTLEADYAAWEEIKTNIESMLSKDGRVVYSQGAGTVTVTDYPSVLNDVEDFIREINDHLTRQVAITVKVYALQTDRDKDHGINIEAMFNDTKVRAISAGADALPDLTGIGTLAATIIDPDSKWEGSNVILKSLKTVGDVTLVTSGSAITLNNQPSPIQVVTEESYLAKVSSTTTVDVGNTSELTPGKVTTGFSMLAIPHVLDAKTVVLQYYLSLSHLDSLDNVSSGQQRIQVPTVSTRSVMQRVKMPLGSTLVLAGYEEQGDSFEEGVGLFGWERKGGHNKELIVIAIEVNSLDHIG